MDVVDMMVMGTANGICFCWVLHVLRLEAYYG